MLLFNFRTCLEQVVSSPRCAWGRVRVHVWVPHRLGAVPDTWELQDARVTGAGPLSRATESPEQTNSKAFVKKSYVDKSSGE